MLEVALSQETARTAPLLPPEEGREVNPFISVQPLDQRYPLSQRKSNFPFLQVLRSTGRRWGVASSLLPTTHLASKQESAVRVRSTSPSTSGKSCLGLQGFLRTRCLLYHPAILPFAAPSQVRQLCSWSRLHGIWRRGSCCPAHLAGSRAQFDSIQALPVSLCLYESRRGHPYSATGSGCQGPQLPRHWLILAQSWETLYNHRDLVLRHFSQLGLWVNWEKSKLSPVQRISLLSVELDSVSMTACLTEECTQEVMNCLNSFRGRNVVPLKQFQRVLEHKASTAAVMPLGLLHLRLLQHWLYSRVLRWAWRHGTLRVNITQECRRSFSPWTDHVFLRAGLPIEQVSRHVVVTTDASNIDWGATCNRQAASAINCLEPYGSASSLMAVPATAVRQACVSLHGQHCGCLVHQPAGRYTITPHVTARPASPTLESHAAQIPACCPHPREAQTCGRCALMTAHIPRRMGTPSQDNSADLESIRGSLGRPVCFPWDLPLSPRVLPRVLPLGTDALAHSWPQALRKYAFPPVSLLAQTLC